MYMYISHKMKLSKISMRQKLEYLHQLHQIKFFRRCGCGRKHILPNVDCKPLCCGCGYIYSKSKSLIRVNVL